jgi:hypothetical protein
MVLNNKSLCLAVVLTAIIAPFTASAQLVSGLQGASGSTVGPGQDLYVTEGALGRITRIDRRSGEMSTFAEGLPPALPWVGIGGAMDVAFIDDSAYALVTLVSAEVGGGDVVGVYRLDGPDDWSVLADIGAWSIANPPSGFDYFLQTGVQYALETYQGGLLVTDGHHNRVLLVTLDGAISEYMAFGNVVPTGLEVHGNTVYLAQAGAIPHEPADGSRIVSFGPKLNLREVGSGAPLLVDVEFGRGRSLFALAQGTFGGGDPGAPALPNTGSLSRVNADGSFTELAGGLNLPTSFEIIGNTAYVVNLVGEVWVFPGLAGPPYGR